MLKRLKEGNPLPADLDFEQKNAQDNNNETAADEDRIIEILKQEKGKKHVEHYGIREIDTNPALREYITQQLDKRKQKFQKFP